MRLRRWMESHRFSEQQLAVALKADRSLVHRWLRGGRPAERYLIEIYRLTHGTVSPNDFYELPRLQCVEAELTGAQTSHSKVGR